ncbi:cytochrome P450 [Longimycelium tulufanense]|uniref:Cytochrome P450 n=2 Tax=Longimycelium tulufanense TaxID=907463 RepID=A0A8J3FY56_9PSEU|nr:cytochrome P450 [Longimycelium tulufanense]
MESLSARGDVVRIYLGTMPAYVVTRPELVHRVLVTDADRFTKGIFLEKFRPFFGNGLALSSGDFYRRQRRLVQPAFHRARLARYAETMAAMSGELVDSWRAGQVVDVDRRMQDLAIGVVGRTLFSTELRREDVEEVQRWVPVLLRDGLVRAFSPKLVEKLPIPGNRRFDVAIARVRSIVGDLVAEARAEGRDRGDLLSTLICARDSETGEGMSDEQVHDEVVTLLTAGTETTAVTLAWLFHEIGRHPEVERQLHAEIDEVLAGRPVTFENLPDLTYMRQVVNEVLRVHSPWLLMRRAEVNTAIGDIELPAGTEVAFSPHALHHDARLFPDPERFDPDRWSPDRAESLPRNAFIPFGSGMHNCPGQSFAHAEIAIAVATVAARWRLVPVPGRTVRTKVVAMQFPSQLPMTVVPRRR